MIRQAFCLRPVHAAWLAVALAAFGTTRATAQNQYFDVNGSTASYGITNGQTYDWDANPAGSPNTGEWGVSGGGANTTAWVAGTFARFYPAGTPTYIVTVTNTESFAGMFFNTPQTVTFNPIGSGNLQLVSGVQGFLGNTSVSATINVPITGVGGVEPENGGSIAFNAVNTYTGGTTLGSLSTLIFFNNNSSFSTGTITMGIAGLVPMLATGGATITLANNFTSTVTGAGINFASSANTPVVSTGTWTLGADNLVLRTAGGPTSPVTLTNTISGTASVTLTANTPAGGLIAFNGANTYSGGTTLTTGGSSTVTLSVNNTSGSGTGTGAVNVTTGTLQGTGFIVPTGANAVTIGASTGVLQPGSSTATGTLTVGSATTASATVINGKYLWNLAAAGAPAAPSTGGSNTVNGESLLAGFGNITANSGWTLTLNDVTGTSTFDNTQAYSWTLATTPGAIAVGQQPTVTVPADYTPDSGGVFYVTSYTNGSGLQEMDLNYSPTPVPEPGTMSLIGLAGAGLLFRRWRRKV